eukprot:gene10514-2642_t
MEHLQDSCGVFGIYATQRGTDERLDVARTATLALTGLQHRGQESAGLAVTDDSGKLSCHKGMGLVEQVFSDDILDKLKGYMAIGHTRYSTAGTSAILCSQPFLLKAAQGDIAVAHNGQLVNAEQLRQRIMQHGVGMVSETDSEIIAQILCAPPPPPSTEHVHGMDMTARLKSFVMLSKLAYSLVVMTNNSVYAVRDPFGKVQTFELIVPHYAKMGNGNRPLALGRLKGMKRDVWVVASETGCFPSIGAEIVREVLPGEIVQMNDSGIQSMLIMPRTDRQMGKSPLSHSTSSSSTNSATEDASKVSSIEQIPPALCIFEYVYFCRTNTILEGQSVHTVRQRCGAQLAIEAAIEADVVAAIPSSAVAAAIGFANESGIPFTEVLSKNRYVGRTFIQPDQRLRTLGVLKKFSPIEDNIRGKRIVLVDDSIVRGTTMAPIIHMLREHGAKEVHVRVASPPLKYPCYMGINIPTRNELIANQVPMERMAEHFGANSLQYLSLEGLKSAVRVGIKETNSTGHCTDYFQCKVQSVFGFACVVSACVLTINKSEVKLVLWFAMWRSDRNVQVDNNVQQLPPQRLEASLPKDNRCLHDNQQLQPMPLQDIKSKETSISSSKFCNTTACTPLSVLSTTNG